MFEIKIEPDEKGWLLKWSSRYYDKDGVAQLLEGETIHEQWEGAKEHLNKLMKSNDPAQMKLNSWRPSE